MRPFFVFEGRQILVRAVGLEPTQASRPNGFSYHFDFRRRRTRRLWSGLSLHLSVAALGAARLVSTPSPFGAWLGIASQGFPEFEQFYFDSFPSSTHIPKSGASTIPPRPQTPTYSGRGWSNQPEAASQLQVVPEATF
jgi:hypothetical protein